MSADETRKSEGQPEIKDIPEKPATTEQEQQVKGGRPATAAASRAMPADSIARAKTRGDV